MHSQIYYDEKRQQWRCDIGGPGNPMVYATTLTALVRELRDRGVMFRMPEGMETCGTTN